MVMMRISLTRLGKRRREENGHGESNDDLMTRYTIVVSRRAYLCPTASLPDRRNTTS